MKLPVLLLLVACFFGCQKKERSVTEKPVEAAVASAEAARKICYEFVEGRSVATAELTFNADSVTGKLNYLLNKKDQSRGTIRGVINGDILRADYRLTSEGVESVVEVIFKLEGDLLVQGHGPMGEQNDKIIYLYPDKVEFSTPFKARACK